MHTLLWEGPLLLAIRWNVNPEIFSIPLPWDGELTLRWYGLLFVSGFIIGQNLMVRWYKQEGRQEDDVYNLTLYVVAGTVLGARLGHCLFYEPARYLSDPITILYIWEGGLASHGGAIGILLAVWLYARQAPDQPYLWILDRLVILVCLGGCFIRLGNLMNSEIFGHATDLPWGFIFERASVAAYRTQPHHPTQIYEALGYLAMFFAFWRYYRKQGAQMRIGTVFGWFLIALFGFRFFVEFLKNDQVSWEGDIPLNMGQWLSIPLVLAGMAVLYYTQKHPIPIPPPVDQWGNKPGYAPKAIASDAAPAPSRQLKRAQKRKNRKTDNS